MFFLQLQFIKGDCDFFQKLQEGDSTFIPGGTAIPDCTIYMLYVHKGPFTNYVYKRRGLGGQKNGLFVKFYTIEM